MGDKDLMAMFCEGSRLRFQLCRVRLLYKTIIKDLQLHGSIQASCFSPDPHDSFEIFNRKFNNPVLVSLEGFQPLDDIRHCSLPVSSTIPVVQIAAKLYITTDKVRDVETSADIDADDRGKRWFANKPINNEVFEVCNDYALIDLSNNPDGGSGVKIFKGKDGTLELYYCALKYAVDADVEVKFVSPSKETKVYGTVVAYYGKNFDYSGAAPDRAYYVTLFQKKRFASDVWSGNSNLIMPSALAVPANSCLIIEADLLDDTSDKTILSGTCVITVGLDGKPTVGSIASDDDFSIDVKVNWKLPSKQLKIPSSPIYPPANSVVTLLAKRWKLGADSALSMADHSTSSMTDPDELNRWSLREELENVFKDSLKRLSKPQEPVCCSISTCTKEDGGDYLCSGVMHIWPELRKARSYKGPKRAGLALKNIMDFDHSDMIESCVVCGPGFVKFKLSRKWITERIYTMLTAGIHIWAPKLSVKKTVIYFLSQTIGEEMHMGHLRSTFIGESLARMLEYSGVVVIRKRITDDVNRRISLLDLDSEILVEKFNNGEDYNQDFGEHEFSDIHISEIIKARNEIVYQRLGVEVEEECYFTEGDKTVFEGPDSPLVYLTALRHALVEEKADRILHVSDEGKQVSIEKCIIGARLAELIGKDLSECPLSHVRFGLAQGDDFKNLEVVNVLDEAKSRCKRLLPIQGMSDEEIEHAAEALGIGALKYADLKNNRLADYTFSFDQILNKEGDTAVNLQFTLVRICSIIKGFSKDIKKLNAEELILKNDDERELGLHLLRFTEVLEEVCKFLAPHILCKYVYDLCVKFDSLEASVHKVVGSSEETSYSLLCRATEVVMRKCFDLLGITSICKPDILSDHFGMGITSICKPDILSDHLGIGVESGLFYV